jgi:hypothetical protein
MKATNCPFANKIDACNSDLIVAITEVIAGNIIPTENHLILPEDLFGLNPKQLDIYETVGKKGWDPSPSCPRHMHRRGTRRGVLGTVVAAVVVREELRQAAPRWWRLHRELSK